MRPWLVSGSGSSEMDGWEARLSEWKEVDL